VDAILALDLPAPPPLPSDIILGTNTSSAVNGDGIRYQRQIEERRAQENLEALAAFDPLADVLWPGSMVQGASLDSGIPNPINLRRTPGEITITSVVFDGIPGRPEPVYREVVRVPSTGNTQTAIQRLVSQKAAAAQPARISYMMKNFYSLDHAMISVGASAQWLTGAVRAGLTSNSYSERSNFVVRLVQAYYTISHEAPSSPASFFDSGVRLAETMPYMGTNNPPAYISSVTYGRMLLFFVSSTASKDELRGSLEAAFSAGVASGQVSVSAQQRQILTSSEIKALFIGGDGRAAVALLAGDKVPQLNQYLAAGSNWSSASPGLPISYQVRYLRDNSLARLSTTTDYTIVRNNIPAYLKPATVRVNYLRFLDTADDDEDMSFSIRLDLLKQDGTIAQTLAENRRCVYVEEASKYSNRHGRWDTFFEGARRDTNEPVLGIRATVTASTCDGDGFRWGIEQREWNLPAQGTLVFEGGNDGRWRLEFTVQ
jgi:hypothetical protein